MNKGMKVEVEELTSAAIVYKRWYTSTRRVYFQRRHLERDERESRTMEDAVAIALVAIVCGVRGHLCQKGYEIHTEPSLPSFLVQLTLKSTLSPSDASRF